MASPAHKREGKLAHVQPHGSPAETVALLSILTWKKILLQTYILDALLARKCTALRQHGSAVQWTEVTWGIGIGARKQRLTHNDLWAPDAFP